MCHPAELGLAQDGYLPSDTLLQITFGSTNGLHRKSKWSRTCQAMGKPAGLSGNALPSVVAPAFLYSPAVPHFNPEWLGQGPHLSSKDGQVMLIWSIQIPLPSLDLSAWYLDG